MKVDSVKNQICISTDAHAFRGNDSQVQVQRLSDSIHAPITFKAKNSVSTKFWNSFRGLSEYMKEPSEMVSAIIQAIGTSVVAPIAILGSPSRNAHTEEEKKQAREKKVFQAFRQPFSALIALFFQVPATLFIARTFDHYAYEKHAKIFRDNDVLGNLIPDKKYLARQAQKALNDNADSNLREEWKEEIEYSKNIDKVKEDFIKETRERYEKYGTEITEEKLNELANDKKKINKFIIDKMASKKHDKLIDAKIEELKSQGKHFEIKDFDLVTDSDRDLAVQRNKAEFEAIKKEKLSWFDKCIKTMGFSNSKISEYNKAVGALKNEKGFQLLQEEIPNINNDGSLRFKHFIKNKNEFANKIYKNKKFWIQLVTNLAMVAISCTVLNWMHPKFMDFLEGVKQAKKEQEDMKKQKVEVRA